MNLLAIIFVAILKIWKGLLSFSLQMTAPSSADKIFMLTVEGAIIDHYGHWWEMSCKTWR